MIDEVSESIRRIVGIGVGVALLVLGMALGFAMAKIAGGSGDGQAAGNATTNGTTTVKAADLRVELVTYGAEHVDLTMQTIEATLNNQPNAVAVKSDLVKNGQNIATVLGSVYGKEAQDNFQKLWNLHLNEFVNYATAAKAGNEGGKSAALAKIDKEYIKPTASLLAGANPYLSQTTLETELADHVTMTATMIEDYVAGRYVEVQADRAESVGHLKNLMSTLAAAIARQFPVRF